MMSDTLQQFASERYIMISRWWIWQKERFPGSVADPSVRVWDRHIGAYVAEPVYSGKLLHFLFRHPVGRTLMHHILSRKLLNKLITAWKKTACSRSAIAPFIARYSINSSEFVQPPESFMSFAEFFARELKPEARPVDTSDHTLVAPCDGQLQWMVHPLADDTAFNVKGWRYNLPQLLGDQDAATSFAGGALLGIYLAPFDYHRFCYPCDGRVIWQRRLGNRYFSVNEASVAAGFRPFDRNHRRCTILDRKNKIWAMIEISGFYAGRISNLDSPDALKVKGRMKGCFELGGSFIALAFSSGFLEMDDDIVQHLAAGTTVRVRMGERIGTFLSGVSNAVNEAQ